MPWPSSTRAKRSLKASAPNHSSGRSPARGGNTRRTSSRPCRRTISRGEAVDRCVEPKETFQHRRGKGKPLCPPAGAHPIPRSRRARGRSPRCPAAAPCRACRRRCVSLRWPARVSGTSRRSCSRKISRSASAPVAPSDSERWFNDSCEARRQPERRPPFGRKVAVGGVTQRIAGDLGRPSRPCSRAGGCPRKGSAEGDRD